MENINVPAVIQNLSIVFKTSQKDVAHALSEMSVKSVNTISSFAESVGVLVDSDTEIPELKTSINDLNKLANCGVKAYEAGRLYAKYLKFKGNTSSAEIVFVDGILKIG